MNIKQRLADASKDPNAYELARDALAAITQLEEQLFSSKAPPSRIAALTVKVNMTVYADGPAADIHEKVAKAAMAMVKEITDACGSPDESQSTIWAMLEPCA
jgi:hypothetical protein